MECFSISSALTIEAMKLSIADSSNAPPRPCTPLTLCVRFVPRDGPSGWVMEAEERWSQRELLALVDVLDEMVFSTIILGKKQQTHSKFHPNTSGVLNTSVVFCKSWINHNVLVLYLSFSSQPAEFFTSSTEVCPTLALAQQKLWRASWRFQQLGISREFFNTDCSTHPPNIGHPNMGGMNIHALILLSWKDWAWKWFLLRCFNHDDDPPPILNIEIIFFDLCIFCLKSEALILDFHQGFQNKKGTFLPPPRQHCQSTAGQVHGVMGFVKQGLVAEVTRASISRAIKLLGTAQIYGCFQKNRGKSPQNGWWK